jgi:uncharacterized glyoxalase superfamily protein PhnB
MLKALTPMLCTDDLAATVQFYTRVLDFECESLDDELGWASVWRDKVNIMFAHPNAHQPWTGPAFTGSIYLYTDDVDKQWSQVQHQVEVCYPPESFDYGMREFGFYDNNGYLLKFGQPIASPSS